MGRLVFISYRRRRGYELAHLVDAQLRSRGLRTFIDVADSDPGRFWPQVKTAIERSQALVLICTNGSFEAAPGDDWVMREVSEAIALGRRIVPVFSQDFEPPSGLPAPLAQAIEHNGVSLDTQFHVAAFDRLSQLVGGRTRSEQRRRVAVLSGLATVALVASLAFGASAIVGLNNDFSREREARREAEAALEQRRTDERRLADERQRNTDARSDKLAQELADSEKKRQDEQRAAEQRLREAEARSARLAEELASAEKKRLAQIAADAAEIARRDQLAQKQAGACRGTCDATRQRCETSCRRDIRDLRSQSICADTCRQTALACTASCR